MLVAAAFTRGWPHALPDLVDWLFLTVIFVVSTPMMATYEGSLLALVIVTGILAAIVVASLMHRGLDLAVGAVDDVVDKLIANRSRNS